ncbi:MAG: DUF4293 domain-containing protein [Bacteroidales bacterium]|jgi:hypothetical protein|nr:DUF4293 domain-containing protein [Bacteroidales bacterium]
MIQRIQTLYLFLTTVLSVLFLNGHIVNFPGSSRNILYIGSDGLNLTNNTGGKETLYILLLITAVILAIFLVSLIAILLFKRRKAQMKMAVACMVLSCLLIIASASYIIIVYRSTEGPLKPGMNIIIMPLILLFSWLAYRGIRKDEDLVKSYDRLR